jgi:glutathionylspermidine synthase
MQSEEQNFLNPLFKKVMQSEEQNFLNPLFKKVMRSKKQNFLNPLFHFFHFLKKLCEAKSKIS